MVKEQNLATQGGPAAAPPAARPAASPVVVCDLAVHRAPKRETVVKSDSKSSSRLGAVHLMLPKRETVVKLFRIRFLLDSY